MLAVNIFTVLIQIAILFRGQNTNFWIMHRSLRLYDCYLSHLSGWVVCIFHCNTYFIISIYFTLEGGAFAQQ
jgi:hypothetical protein